MLSLLGLDLRNTWSVSPEGITVKLTLEKYAVEHRLPVMAPSWIQNGHARWLKGEELDLTSEIEIHKLKPFWGLKIAISGIEPSTSDRFSRSPRNFHLDCHIDGRRKDAVLRDGH